MIDEKSYDAFALQLFGLENIDVQSIKVIRSGNNIIIDIFLVPKPIPCPWCSFEHPHVKNYVLKKITHSELTDRGCTIHYHARRFECPICKRTYYEQNPFVFKNMKISIKTVYNILEALKKSNETFSSVANTFHISPTTVASIFDAHVDIKRKTLPERICIDETYAFQSDTSKYICLLLDFDTQKPIDVLPSRHFEYLKSYFLKIPKKERENVLFLCSDMYDCYRSVAKACLPNAITIVDHYHVIQDLNRHTEAVRIQVMKAHKKNDPDSYYLLKKFNWMIYRNEESQEETERLKEKGKLPIFDPNNERKYNKHFNQYINYYEIREKIRNIDKELTEAWNLKDDVKDFYDEANLDNAEIKLDELITKFTSSSVAEMKDFGKTLKKWKKEIINSFHVMGYEYKVSNSTGRVAVQEKKMNNAIIENRNSIIKIIKKNANGYSNWTRFRNRTLYVLDKDSTYSMYPIRKDK